MDVDAAGASGAMEVGTVGGDNHCMDAAQERSHLCLCVCLCPCPCPCPCCGNRSTAVGVWRETGLCVRCHGDLVPESVRPVVPVAKASVSSPPYSQLEQIADHCEAAGTRRRRRDKEPTIDDIPRIDWPHL